MTDSKHSRISRTDILRLTHSTERGLTEREANARCARDGRNVISEKPERGVVREFLSHLVDPLLLILAAAAGISFWFGETMNAVIIAIMIVASACLDFYEEHSASNAARALKANVATTTTVIRDGKKKEIVAAEVCVGDMVFLSSGDLVPADGVVLTADDFFVNQSALTGESFPKEKMCLGEDSIEEEVTVYLGSSVVSGTATVVITKIGAQTAFGDIAETLLQKQEKSDFERGIGRFGIFLSKIILVLVTLIFLLQAIMQRDLLQSFLFAIAIAVGVTPELLPVILSVTMARGSERMAKEGVIVKRLSSIPNFGSMDVLCTDKTGTLTEDHIQLVHFMNAYGERDESVLRYTYVNSAFQTGVKNPLDKAVLEFGEMNIDDYQKTEEIPFDFVRKVMSVAVLGKEGRVLITKGAPEEVLARCTHITQGKTVLALNEEHRAQAYSMYEKLSKEGYRVLGVALKTELPEQVAYTKDDEKNLTFLGFVSFLDPAKQDVRAVLTELEAYGIEIKIITGDNEFVTRHVCSVIDLPVKGVLLGSELGALSDEALQVRARATTIFARFTPDQKERVIRVLRASGHVVGYMGDGINDAPSLRAADVGISVNTAVDVAKESADMILTRKGLESIVRAVVEGRRSFGNTMKYIMMGLSSNVGNMFSVLAAVLFLPFLPMLPLQILLNNFIYDVSQVTISSDRVDEEWVKRPRTWNLKELKRYMIVFGSVSSLFDLLTFGMLFFVFGASESVFQTAWFMESLATQTLVIHVIRTHKLPFVHSRSSRALFISTIACVLVGWVIPFTPLGAFFHFAPLSWPIFLTIVLIVCLYLGVVELTKRGFYRWRKEF